MIINLTLDKWVDRQMGQMGTYIFCQLWTNGDVDKWGRTFFVNF